MPKANPVDLADVERAFKSDEPFKGVSRRLGLSPARLRRLWVKTFGQEAFDARSSQHRKGASPKALAEADASWYTDEPFKRVASRLGTSPNTLRDRWIQQHGREAFQARGKRLQQKGATAYGTRTSGVPKRSTKVQVCCVSCKTEVTLTKSQLSKLSQVLCDGCLGKDTECQVCGLLCIGRKGLASHFRHQSDSSHKEYADLSEELKWAGLLESVDYATCQVCGFRAKSIHRHICTHNLSIEAYLAQYPGSTIRSKISTQKRSLALQDAMAHRAFDWDRDTLLKYADEKGRVIVAEAALSLGSAEGTVRQYCQKLGLPTRNNLAWQRRVLDHAQACLGSGYVWEWSDPQIVNPETGRRFNFDGYFPDLDLIVEAHGEQHFRYSEAWHGTKEHFEDLRTRDSLKRSLAEDQGHRFVIVRPSDPIEKASFWKRLVSGETSLWDNLTKAEQISQIQKVFRQVRAAGWPVVEPVRLGTVKAELSKLISCDMHLDEDRNVRPYSTRGTMACGSFFPNRYEAKHVSATMSVQEAWDDDTMLRKAIKLQLDSGHPTTPERVRKALIMYCRCPSVFRPAVAKYVYQTCCPEGGVVWDPCAGYGGRLMGALAAGVGKYIATEVEPQTVLGNQALAKALEAESRCLIHQEKAEAFTPQEPVDVVFTSPPYFNVETYGSASGRLYEDYGSPRGWLDKFLGPVIRTAWTSLRGGGHLVLNLPTKPVQGVRLDVEALRLAQELGFEAQDPFFLPVRRIKAQQKREPMLVWCKS